VTVKGQTRDPNTLGAQYLENYLSYRLQICYAALYRECLAGAQIIFPESGRDLGYVTLQFLAVRSAILATAWLLVSISVTVTFAAVDFFKHLGRLLFVPTAYYVALTRSRDRTKCCMPSVCLSIRIVYLNSIILAVCLFKSFVFVLICY